MSRRTGYKLWRVRHDYRAGALQNKTDRCGRHICKMFMPRSDRLRCSMMTRRSTRQTGIDDGSGISMRYGDHVSAARAADSIRLVVPDGPAHGARASQRGGGCDQAGSHRVFVLHAAWGGTSCSLRCVPCARESPSAKWPAAPNSCGCHPRHGWCGAFRSDRSHNGGARRGCDRRSRDIRRAIRRVANQSRPVVG